MISNSVSNCSLVLGAEINEIDQDLCSIYGELID